MSVTCRYVLSSFSSIWPSASQGRQIWLCYFNCVYSFVLISVFCIFSSLCLCWSVICDCGITWSYSIIIFKNAIHEFFVSFHFFLLYLISPLKRDKIKLVFSFDQNEPQLIDTYAKFDPPKILILENIVILPYIV